MRQLSTFDSRGPRHNTPSNRAVSPLLRRKRFWLRSDSSIQGAIPISGITPDQSAASAEISGNEFAAGVVKGGTMSLRQIAGELAKAGYFNERGRTYAAKSVRSMLAWK